MPGKRKTEVSVREPVVQESTLENSKVAASANELSSPSWALLCYISKKTLQFLTSTSHGAWMLVRVSEATYLWLVWK